jgi:hypothetical protein
MLLDETHAPRRECRVPEKGRSLRCFITSDVLQSKIKHLADFLRAKYPDTGLQNAYLLNVNDIQKPLWSVYNIVRRLASDAGIKEVHVHPHAFRHTLVGSLVSAGNSLDVVSKFMGHANASTTSYFYWLPTSEELCSTMKTPSQHPLNVKKNGDDVKLLTVANAKVAACRKMIDLLVQEIDPKRLKTRVPGFYEILQDIDTPSALCAPELTHEPLTTNTDFY